MNVFEMSMGTMFRLNGDTYVLVSIDKRHTQGWLYIKAHNTTKNQFEKLKVSDFYNAQPLTQERVCEQA